jgi:hypothetical protein
VEGCGYESMDEGRRLWRPKEAVDVSGRNAGGWEDRWGDARGNTSPLAWPDQTDSSRFGHGSDSDCHDVSVTAVGHLGLGSKTAILTMHPW